MRASEEPEELYGIGAVVERTGLLAPAIRMWEKRYEVVIPRRSETNRRLYSAEDIERLSLLKLLTDRGHAIRIVAGLTLEQLRKRVGESGPLRDPLLAPRSGGQRNRLILVGPGLESLVRDRDMIEVEIVEEVEEFSNLEGAEKMAGADLLVVSTDMLFPEMVPELRKAVEKSGAARTILAYRFASSKTATALAKVIEGLSLLRAPVNPNQLRRECLVQLNAIRSGGTPGQIDDPGPVPDRLYDADQLSRLTRTSSVVECECPRHMAGILQGLAAFEQYSEECEDRNPQDALLHAFLHRTTAQVRRQMEEALRHLVLTEGISLE